MRNLRNHLFELWWFMRHHILLVWWRLKQRLGLLGILVLAGVLSDLIVVFARSGFRLFLHNVLIQIASVWDVIRTYWFVVPFVLLLAVYIVVLLVLPFISALISFFRAVIDTYSQTLSLPRPSPGISPSRNLARDIIRSETTRNLQFTAFHPKEVKVESSETLIVYTHLFGALDAVRADAKTLKTLLGEAPRMSTVSAQFDIPHGTELVLIPHLSGVEFFPNRIPVVWTGNRPFDTPPRSIFQFRAAKFLAGTAGNGEITVCTQVGQVPIAMIPLAMLFNGDMNDPFPDTQEPFEAEKTAYLFRRIFLSYSHRDTAIVQACYALYQALGIDVKMDIWSLRSGQEFAPELQRLIEGADVFQLFWSKYAAESKWVTREWHFALSKRKEEGFVRPLYWEEPMFPLPQPLAPFHATKLAIDQLRIRRRRRWLWRWFGN